MLEAELLRSAPARIDRQRAAINKLRAAFDVVDASEPSQLPKSRSQFLHHAVFPVAQLVEIDFRLVEGDPPIRRLPRFGDDSRDLQQGFGWNAAGIKADAAGVGRRGYEGDVGIAIG